MRTTLSLDDDVAAALKRLRKSRDASFKELVNEALRQGLRQMNSSAEPALTARSAGAHFARAPSISAAVASAASTAPPRRSLWPR